MCSRKEPHTEIARRDKQTNANYCKKDGNWKEFENKDQGAVPLKESIKLIHDEGNEVARKRFRWDYT